MFHLAQHDSLTGLPNRTGLQEELTHAMARASRHDNQLAVLFMDLDRFKTINDTLGHSVGDQLLNSIGPRVRDCIREADTVFRYSGDEFVVLLEDIQQSEYAGKVAEKIAAAIRRPFNVQGLTLHTSASIGVSIYPRDGQDAETLLKNADIAMYRAKDMGRNNATFYSAEMNASAVQRMVIESELRQALHLRQFELHYQPQYDAQGVHLKGCEALIRWRKSEDQLVTPSEFIPVLEETGLIKPVGAWVIERACAQLVEWRALGWALPRISVNVSCQQLTDHNLLNQLRDCLHRREIKPEWLELEITESMLVRQDPTTAQIIQGFVDLGLRLAIDDFGTGYSSLSYLHRMSIDTLKIDRAFVKNIPGKEDSEAITRAIVALGKSMRLELVAEGVETTAQAAFLKELGCDLLQGYLFSRPLPAEEFEQLLRSSLDRAATA
jgi:diguanylate cyclase (GGDEF)-like protein